MPTAINCCNFDDPFEAPPALFTANGVGIDVRCRDDKTPICEVLITRAELREMLARCDALAASGERTGSNQMDQMEMLRAARDELAASMLEAWLVQSPALEQAASE